jgi:hypothetical protein
MELFFLGSSGIDRQKLPVVVTIEMFLHIIILSVVGEKPWYRLSARI